MEVTFFEYQQWINKYIMNNDTREINFQNDVVKRLLEKLFDSYDIVSVDTKGCESKHHDYYAYSGKYTDDKGKEKATTPDLLICKNWNWYNKENKEKISYIATVEVKSPYSTEAIYKKTHDEYFASLKTKITQHLSAREISKVIITDTLKWEFYEKSYDNYETIELVDRVKKGRGYAYTWKEEASEEFNRLLHKLNQFLI